MIEEVNGIVVGPITRMCKVLNPLGQEMERRHFEISADDGEMRRWAEGVVKAKREEIGDAECKRLGYDKEWELRIYD